ncbi:uncharacterized protein LOC135312541 [Phalacrocorax carbo]|uniref:uncharacterized protein LOC135312541 n=1 Tax=Phalacrocorax carbo TaxID=9209 RepID=UPI003119EC56
MVGKPGRSEGRRELGAIASLLARGWGWPLDQLPPHPRRVLARPAAPHSLPSGRPPRQLHSRPLRVREWGRAATAALHPRRLPPLDGAAATSPWGKRGRSLPPPGPPASFSFSLLPGSAVGNGRGVRGSAKTFSCLPSLGAGYLAPSLLSLPSSGPRAGRGSSALSPATVRTCLQAAASPPGSCCSFQTQLSRPLTASESLASPPPPCSPPPCASASPGVPGHPHPVPLTAAPSAVSSNAARQDGAVLQCRVPLSWSMRPQQGMRHARTWPTGVLHSLVWFPLLLVAVSLSTVEETVFLGWEAPKI